MNTRFGKRQAAIGIGLTLLAMAAALGAQVQPAAPARVGPEPAAGPAVYSLAAAQQAQAATAGGVPQGKLSGQTIALTLDDALARALRANLAVLLSDTQSEQARAARWQALSALLPQVQGEAADEETKVSLAAYGFPVGLIPGIPPVVGPFHVYDFRAYIQESVLNLSSLQGWRAAKAEESAAHYSYREARDLVALAVTNQYLLAQADASRVAAAQAELATATQARQQADDMHAAGTVSALDVVRAEVEERQQQQTLIVADDNLAKQRLALLRAIGLPPGQSFTLTDAMPNAGEPALTPATAVGEALGVRPDYQAAQEAVRAARLQLKAAREERLPTFSLGGNWGAIGNHLNTGLLPTFTIEGAIDVPVFAGGRMHADALNAAALLRAAQDRAADLRAAIDQEVRSDLLDLSAASYQVQVAAQARALAHQELTLARDRFQAGVGDNLEEVQAEQQVAVAEESYIGSLYAYNAAKAGLARAVGMAATAYGRFLKGDR